MFWEKKKPKGTYKNSKVKFLCSKLRVKPDISKVTMGPLSRSIFLQYSGGRWVHNALRGARKLEIWASIDHLGFQNPSLPNSLWEKFLASFVKELPHTLNTVLIQVPKQVWPPPKLLKSMKPLFKSLNIWNFWLLNITTK